MFNRQFKRTIAPIAAVLILCLTVGAQIAPVEKVDLEMMKKIREEGLERSQVMDTLSWLTDVVGQRLTGSPGMKAANEWTKERLTKYGLVNAKVEPWGTFGRGWSFDKVSIHVTEPTSFPVIGYPKAWTPGTNGPVVGEVIFANIQTEADFEKYKGKLKGAIVLSQPVRTVNAWFKAPGSRATDEELLRLANAEPPTGQPQRGGPPQGNPDQINQMMQARAIAGKRAEFLKSEGAAVIVDYSRVGDGGTVFVQGGGSQSADAPIGLPAITIAVEHYNRIIRILDKGIKVKMEVDIKAQFHNQDLNAYNTVAEIPGTDKKEELVMLGGHMDSWHGGTGATDNAAGVSVAMEAVRILKALGVQPRRTIRIALWSGEEEGLLGSRGYVANHFASRPAPAGGQQRGGGGGFGGPQGPLTIKPDYDKFSVYFNLDNGTGKIRGVYLQGNEAARPIFRAWLSPFKDLGASTITINNTGGTDHQAFDGVGLPGFQFIQDEVEYSTRTHHSNMDVYDRIQADDMKQAATIMAAFVYNAAMREDKFPRKPIPGQQQATR
ncbi:MAG TPA: M20/M25/M40 family metallo-hydrolase [Blastocatellia bacterium]